MNQEEATLPPAGSGVDVVDAGNRHRTPAEPGIWVFILLDMLIFTEMFVIFTWYRAENRDLFHGAQQAVDPWYGLLYTMLLLTSSWCVVMAVSAARKRQIGLAGQLSRWAIGLGAAFAVIKLVEYGTKLAAGITPVTNDFFMFYFVLTIIHLLHATVGLGVLVFVRRQILTVTTDPAPDGRDRMRVIEAGAVYWHMVDLLWIVLFALFYLRG